jgi:hypothetical protein
MNELQKLLSEQVDWHIIAITSVIIIGVAVLAVLSWLLDDLELPEEKIIRRAKELNMFDDDDEYEDYNDRTG